MAFASGGVLGGDARRGLRRERVVRGTRRMTVTAATASGLKKVVLAGGSGTVGTSITTKLVEDGCDEVVILSRKPVQSAAGPVKTVLWDGQTATEAVSKALSGSDALINLCGELIVQPWTEKTKKKIVDSRLVSTKTLVSAMELLNADLRPKAFLSSSAVGYYGISDYEEFNENSGPGDDFLADLCVKWEAAAEAAKKLDVRTVIMRNGIVLGPGGGALKVMLPVFKYGLGGNLGSGDQWVSWINIDDAAAIFVDAAADESMEGAYNVTAPNPCTSGEMTNALAKVLRRPAIFPAPAFAIKTVFGEGATVLLDGQKVLPSRLVKKGFKFGSKTIEQGMANAVKAAQAAEAKSK